MITILFTYRNKDLIRVKNCLLSLQNQTVKNFEILFIDYGSQSVYSLALKELLEQFPDIHYHYTNVENQPWSRSKAINVGLKLLTTPYVFVADIDMFFREDFVEKLLDLASPNRSIYFKVGFLSKETTDFSKNFQAIPIAFSSEAGAQGLSLFSTDKLHEINGFDEFYHFWGSEDEDVHIRLQNAGFEVSFYDSEILMLHQWHPNYRSLERKVLTTDLQLLGVVQLNHQHLKNAITQKSSKANGEYWGISISQQEYQLLQAPDRQIFISNKKAEIDHFFYFTFQQKRNIVTEYRFHLDPDYRSLKQNLKKILRKKVPHYYTLKEINDFALLHLVSSLEIKNYRCLVAPDLKSISLIF
ncbi:galactosyltransferase-related protein [Flavobacterium sp. MC2016-06]|jgi:glycosyltransferase involved in cell wall biosynthesis|uniref:glycosyltransferase family 2 protein n=1 Tax=Flavobacterium sp. MC2016-06 TaxID=2676308 RepID=UPI0012BA7E17|nr:galactosyltransferase-related protein [Flavobacterium sp. MC2016-06]MBU3858669.1 glycosyltransferase [Flavobacterium sp. MC2016-06]